MKQLSLLDFKKNFFSKIFSASYREEDLEVTIHQLKEDPNMFNVNLVKYTDQFKYDFIPPSFGIKGLQQAINKASEILHNYKQNAKN